MLTITNKPFLRIEYGYGIKFYYYFFLERYEKRLFFYERRIISHSMLAKTV